MSQLPTPGAAGAPSPGGDLASSNWRRALGLLLVCALLAMLLSVDWLYAGLQQLLAAAKPVIQAHPLWGGVLFVVLSALSAMLAFFSSALLMPVALVTWGPVLTILLLWLGWLLGGASAYGLGRYVGRPLIRSVASARVTDYYLQRLPSQVDLPIALLIQLALPSEIPGYLFGTLRVRFRTYVLALALVEAPYAVGTVLLGENLIARQAGWLIAIAAVGIGTSLLALALLHRRLGTRDPAAARRGSGRDGGVL
ncbi:VTT domain-containing protein [Cognatiluteimonas profundi]|uniref:VTT domain-containing protein n=1 Tax=Cognatiluteimonas profundi TaxID=2594501 RepID=UPI00131C190B|nr:VTT domain-containing protein [Lysobacter profundi]